MNIKDSIKFLETQVKNPTLGLPEDILLFIGSLTPLINVDLLIKDEERRTLLSWRDDQYAGTGWHIPGGIIRYKEDIKTRIQKVIETEIHLPVEFESEPIAVNQLICNSKSRAHFISLLFKCFIPSKHVLDNKGLTEKDRGFLKWHESCPTNLIRVHDIYRKYI